MSGKEQKVFTPSEIVEILSNSLDNLVIKTKKPITDAANLSYFNVNIMHDGKLVDLWFGDLNQIGADTVSADYEPLTIYQIKDKKDVKESKFHLARVHFSVKATDEKQNKFVEACVLIDKAMVHNIEKLVKNKQLPEGLDYTPLRKTITGKDSPNPGTQIASPVIKVKNEYNKTHSEKSPFIEQRGKVKTMLYDFTKFKKLSSGIVVYKELKYVDKNGRDVNLDDNNIHLCFNGVRSVMGYRLSAYGSVGNVSGIKLSLSAAIAYIGPCLDVITGFSDDKNITQSYDDVEAGEEL